MGKINGLHKFRKPLAYLPGLFLLSLGLYLVIKQPQVAYVINQILKEVELREGAASYKLWKDFKVPSKIWIFEVTNPDGVMDGEHPVIREIGPFVYDVHVQRHIISIDENLDEINYTTSRTYEFNATASGNLTEDTVVTMINFAYMGVIKTLLDNFPAFAKKLGPDIHHLFPDTTDLFLRGKAGDILFKGMPVICGEGIPKSLNLVCKALKGNPPPILKKTDQPGVFSYSIFSKLNETSEGPLTVNRGIKNKDSLGNTTSFKGMRVLKFWNSDEANAVTGVQSIPWPPGLRGAPIKAFVASLCRSLDLELMEKTVLHGLVGHKYGLKKPIITKDNRENYCSAVTKEQKECLPDGLMDVTKCQDGGVIIFSEPHFFHCPSDVNDYVEGLHYDDERDKMYSMVEPLTGSLLAGYMKAQFNTKMRNVPAIPFLVNVTEGYMPIVWLEEGMTATLKDVAGLLNSHRLISVVRFLSWPPLFIGIWLIAKVALVGDQPYYQIKHARYPRGRAVE